MPEAPSQIRLSIVVPMRNEAAQLPGLLAHLSPLQSSPTVEVILVDGGSDDRSAELAREAGYTVIDAPVGRARQMNAGASRARGEVLLFLHADSRLPEAAPAAIGDGLAGGKRVWGRFDVRIDGRSFWLKPTAWLMNRRSCLTGIATGDQGLFMTCEAFRQVGGFPDQPLMEDIEISRRLKRLSRPLCLRQRITTSGRRWDRRGTWRTILLMWRLRLAYWRGTDPAALARRYEQ